MDYNTQLKNQPSWLIDTDARYNSSLPNLCSQAVSQGKQLLLTRTAWTFTANFTCGAKHIEMLYGASIKPGIDVDSNPVNMNISGSFNAGLFKVFDYSLGGTIHFTGAIPTVHPEWWGGGVNDATIDTAAESAAVGAISNNTTPCGMITHTANRIYALGAVTAVTCGIIDGNSAIIKPSTTGNVFTLNAGTPAAGGILQRVTLRGFNWQTGVSTPTNLILVNTATDSLITGNMFGVVAAQYGIHTIPFGTRIRDNEFRSGNTWSGAAIFIDNSLGAANSIKVTGNDLTQQNGLCVLLSGGRIITLTENIFEGCTAGGVSWNGSSSLFGLNYQNYNEANTTFDLNFADTTSRAFATVIDSGFTGGNCTNCVVISKNTVLKISHSIFDAACVDTNASALFTNAHYVSEDNISFDGISGCNVLTEATSTLLARIPSEFTFFGSNDRYIPPTAIAINRPTCNAAHKGYTTMISDGDLAATWGVNTGTPGSAANILFCDGTNWTIVGR